MHCVLPQVPAWPPPVSGSGCWKAGLQPCRNGPHGDFQLLKVTAAAGRSNALLLAAMLSIFHQSPARLPSVSESLLCLVCHCVRLLRHSNSIINRWIVSMQSTPKSCTMCWVQWVWGEGKTQRQAIHRNSLIKSKPLSPSEEVQKWFSYTHITPFPKRGDMLKAVLLTFPLVEQNPDNLRIQGLIWLKV